uniref:Uncharacterized protein n=1 Tax=Candidatus Kentrum sp. SD TaxID=2126332 RepID=A0A450YEE8_9GAMM|nr:MAG: hypothetical protein BECKSD772F_GA0070984_104910 [Candidatus Kentron sp. SD]
MRNFGSAIPRFSL